MSPSRPRIRVLHVVSELYPWVKTGGLGDVAAALPIALRSIGVDARVLVPGYPSILEAVHKAKPIARDGNLFGGGPARLLEARLSESPVPAYVLDCPGLYGRWGGPYQDETGVDWADNHRRFAALGWAAAWLAGTTLRGTKPHVVHAHDWQASLSVAHVKLAHGDAAPACFTTIHSIAYPGAFPASVFGELGLPPSAYSIEGVEFFGRVSFLKAGLFYADRITTVSPTYASEIQQQGLGGGFEGLLRSRSRDLTGILNGVDYDEWNPETDPHLPAPYSVGAIEGKAISKSALQMRFGLEVNARAPLFGVVSRLVWQKGIDWVVELVPWLVERGGGLVVIGTGDSKIAGALSDLSKRYPHRVGVLIGYDEALAHLVQAGSDALLVPSRAEPCGLTQLYALRYGSLPVVRRTGGLADTVVDATDGARGDGTATGFSFDEPTVEGLRGAMSRALHLHEQPVEWRKLCRTAMSANFDWSRSARRYAELYEAAVRRRKLS